MITGIVKDKELTPLTNIVSSEAVINLIYPVGSIYTSLDATFNPNDTWTGTTWELQKEGIFIEATQDDTKVGKETEAGAPNITGSATGRIHSNNTSTTNAGYFNGATGCVEITTKGYYLPYSNGNNSYKKNSAGFTIDASKSSAVYGKSNTIQPYSVKAKVWKRTK